MANVPIAKSFKGILRISPIMDGPDADKLLTEKYYKNYNPAFEEGKDSGLDPENAKLDFADGAYSSTQKPLDGELIRYSSQDKFKNGKLPVTDSLGNYMNFNVGLTGTVFGSAENEKNNNNIENGSFPVLEANHIVIGVKKIKTHVQKTDIFGGKLNILGGTKDAELYIENSFCQDDITDGSRYSQMVDNPKYKTLFTPGSKEIKEYDALILNQEFNHKNEDGDIISKVQIRNLADIVKDRLEKYIQNSVVEMPTASVIWQYINLNKWYAAGDDGDVIDFAGHRPKMINTTPEIAADEKYVFYSSRIQGICKEINRLLNNRANRIVYEDGTTETVNVREIVPVYKRDYVLCDGTVYSVPASPYETSINGVVETKPYAAYNRFKNLFSTIGYHYTSDKNIKPHFLYRELDGKYSFWTVNEEGAPETEIENNGLFFIDTATADHEILFNRDYCQLLAFYYIYEQVLLGKFGVSADDLGFDRNAAENWLKTEAKFKKEDFFTSQVLKDSDRQLYYIQPAVNSGGSAKDFKINLGTEVNSFNSDITLDKSTRCKVWQLPEVQLILDLFDVSIGKGLNTPKYYPEKKIGEIVTYYEMNNMLKKYCDYKFQVPNFNAEKAGKYKLGCFMGSSGIYSFSDINEFTGSPSNCFFTANELPHRHNLFIGWNHYGQNNQNCSTVPPTLGAAGSSSRPSAYAIFNTNGNRPGAYCYDNTDNYVVQFDTRVTLSRSWMEQSQYPPMLTRDNGYCCEMMMRKDGQDDQDAFLCEPDRGITSDQVNESNLYISKQEMSQSANLIAESAEYFAPESIMMLPLIKL